MKRYKTLFVFSCGNGHQNLFDSRIVADSQEKAVATSIAALRGTKCKWCESSATNRYQVVGTEEVPLYEVYHILGYTCHCGEKVEALRAAEGIGHEIPDNLTVQCSKGHSRKITNREFLSLERWTEQTQ